MGSAGCGLVHRASQLLCKLSFRLNAQCLFFLNGLFTDKLKANSVPEQPKEEKEVVKPSVAVAEPESSPSTVAEKPGKKTESARIQQKDKKRWICLSGSLFVSPAWGQPAWSWLVTHCWLTSCFHLLNCVKPDYIYLSGFFPGVSFPFAVGAPGPWVPWHMGGDRARLSSVGGDGFPRDSLPLSSLGETLQAAWAGLAGAPVLQGRWDIPSLYVHSLQHKVVLVDLHSSCRAAFNATGLLWAEAPS